MKNKDRLYLAFFALIVLIYSAFQVFGPQPLNWENSFSGSDTIPYGSFILKQELPSLFPNDRIETMYVPLYEELNKNGLQDEPPKNRIFINSSFDPDPVETKLLLQSVSDGDNVFISASAIGDQLADSLGIELGYETRINESDSLNGPPAAGDDGKGLNLSNSTLSAPEGWVIDMQRITYFSAVDSLKSKKLGYFSGSGRVNFISISKGKGKIFMHLIPHAFTNYYLRDPEFAVYAFKVLSYLPARSTVWDEYYKDGRLQYTTPLGYILSEPPLRKAWYLIMTGIFLFMIFQSRRLQRAVPIRNKPENSTLKFAETIAGLYLEKGTHKDMANKKIRFFRDWCREHLGLLLTRTEQPPAEKVAAQAGVSAEQVHELFALVAETEAASQISKEQLKAVSSKIDQFYKNSER